jgi:hypothetical protein
LPFGFGKYTGEKMRRNAKCLPPSAVMTEQYYAQPPAICASATEAYPVCIAKWAIHIRRGPGTEYPIVRIARGREIFMITAQSSGTGASQWGHIQGGEGWISLDLTQRLDHMN